MEQMRKKMCMFWLVKLICYDKRVTKHKGERYERKRDLPKTKRA